MCLFTYVVHRSQQRSLQRLELDLVRLEKLLVLEVDKSWLVQPLLLSFVVAVQVRKLKLAGMKSLRER